MNVGRLGSEGMPSSVLRVWACSRVLGYPSLETKEIQNIKDAMTGHLTGSRGADLHNLLTSTFSA